MKNGTEQERPSAFVKWGMCMIGLHNALMFGVTVLVIRSFVICWANGWQNTPDDGIPEWVLTALGPALAVNLIGMAILHFLLVSRWRKCQGLAEGAASVFSLDAFLTSLQVFRIFIPGYGIIVYQRLLNAERRSIQEHVGSGKSPAQ